MLWSLIERPDVDDHVLVDKMNSFFLVDEGEERWLFVQQVLNSRGCLDEDVIPGVIEFDSLLGIPRVSRI